MTLYRQIIFYLLFALPLAMLGQVILPQSKGTDWSTMLQNGGFVRKNNKYIYLEQGYTYFVGMDFVNGYTLGPRATFGIVNKDYSRWELDEDIKWGFSRERLMAKGALRYVFQPQYFGFLEVFGGKFTHDFNHDAIEDYQRQIATTLFGSSPIKLYDRTYVGIKGSVALNSFLQMRGEVSWDKRTQVENHRNRSLFGKKGGINVPYVHGEAMPDFGEDKLMRMQLGFDFTPGRRIFVQDDMHSTSASRYPTFSLLSSAGFNDGLRYLSLDLSVDGTYKIASKSNQILYFASGGFFPVRKQLLLMDYHHFDTSTSLWRWRKTITWTTLLENYELATTEKWIQGHVEWDYKHLYSQLHAIKTPGMPSHEEIAFGVEYFGNRIGVAVGFKDMDYYKAAVRLIINLQKLSEGLKNKTIY